MKVNEIKKLLKKDGWFIVSTRGSHIHYKHPIKPGKVTVPQHGGEIPKGTLNSILKQAGFK